VQGGRPDPRIPCDPRLVGNYLKYLKMLGNCGRNIALKIKSIDKMIADIFTINFISSGSSGDILVVIKTASLFFELLIKNLDINIPNINSNKLDPI
jgi:hypothetical protein